MQTPPNYSAIALLLVGLAFVLLALRNTIRYFNQSRRARYYILREEAARGAGRWAVVSVLGIALTVALVATQAQSAPGVGPTATPATRVPTIGLAPTRTATPTRSPTPTLAPTTPTLTPTATLAPDVPAALLTPIPSAVPPQPAAQFEFLTLASQLDANNSPANPGLQFPASASRVYVFFRAGGVDNGVPWGIFCYRDGSIFDSFVGLWEDGPRSQTARAFCSHDGRAGTFVLRAYLNTALAFEVQYTLTQ